MSNVFQSAKFSEQVQKSAHIETFHVGDSVVVDTKIQEGDKTRTQKYKGIVIKISGRGPSKTFTVRHIGPMNVGVERTFPFISPWITGVKVEKQGHVRRAKLYYLRDRIGRKARNIRARKSQ
jgi:large subunit ribosomal protein L19